MIKYIVENIGGVGLFGVISILLFFVFFTGMLLWAAFLKKPFLHSMGELPLDDGECEQTKDQSSQDHE